MWAAIAAALKPVAELLGSLFDPEKRRLRKLEKLRDEKYELEKKKREYELVIKTTTLQSTKERYSALLGGVLIELARVRKEIAELSK